MGKRTRKNKQLDEAVDMTFPASDPTAPGDETATEPSRRPADRKPPRITREEVEAAAHDEGHRHLRAKPEPAETRRRKHRGLASEGLHSGDEAKATGEEAHGAAGRGGLPRPSGRRRNK